MVRIEAPFEPLILRTFAILRDRVEKRSRTQIVRTESGAQMVLAIASNHASEACRIDEAGSAVRVAGVCARGLLYGVGKLLRAGRGDTGFAPSPWRGTSTPQGSLRGVYLATHFHNWYHLASHAETARYCEDLALWGINDVMVAFPMINLEGWDDPEADPAVTMVLRYARAARDVGLSFTTGVNNPLFRGAPGFWRRRCTGVSPTGAGRAGDESWCSCGRCPTGNASPAVAWARSRPRPPWAGWPSSITARWRPTIRTTTAFGRR